MILLIEYDWDIKNIGKIKDNNISEDNLLDDIYNKFFFDKFNKFKDKIDKCKLKKGFMA